MKRILVAALAFCFSLSMIVMPAMAVPATPYDYTVVLYSGTGTFNDGSTSRTFTYAYDASSPAIFDGLGDIAALQEAVTPADDRYFVKGIRLVGDDNSQYTPTPGTDKRFTVDKDLQCIVTYGLTKSRVPYVVNYVDEAGNALAESQTFYGSVGDSPTVAYRYIERYLPNAYAIQGTLSSDSSQNEFTFVYREIPIINYETPAEPEQGGTVNIADAAGPTDVPAAEGGALAGVAPGDAAAVEAAAADGALIGDDGNPLAAPEDIINIQDEENPLSNFAVQNEQNAGFPWPLLLTGISAALLLAVVIVLIVIKRTRDREDEQAYYDYLSK